MDENKDPSVFNAIAPIYGWFFDYQRARFRRALQTAGTQLDLSGYRSVMDVGCGTGALAAELHARGHEVAGVEPAQKMLAIASQRLEGTGIPLHQADVLQGLPFPDKAFDVSIASYVAHGLQQPDRLRMYAEMARVSRRLVILHDFNRVRSPVVNVLETMEGSDYFRFIQVAEEELRGCACGDVACFAEVRSFPVEKRANWYVGTIR